MGIEIERKFLVVGQSWREYVDDSRYIAQAYLGGERCSIRVRLDGDEANLNIKGMTLGIKRAEFEYAIPREDAEQMLEQFGGDLVEKRRHRVRHGSHVWEIDEFLGDNRPLVVAEVELSRVDESIALPSWIGKEVSNDERYYNVMLAMHPFRRWEHDDG